MQIQQYPAVPLHAANIQSDPKALIDLPIVSGLVGMKRSKLYDLINPESPNHDHEFPKPIKLGPLTRWVRGEVDAWIASQIAKRDAALSAERESRGTHQAEGVPAAPQPPRRGRGRPRKHPRPVVGV